MTFSGHQQVHVHSHKLTYLNFQPSPHPPTHTHMPKALITANIKQMSSELCNIKPYVGSVSFPNCLSPLSPSNSLSSHLSLPPPEVWCSADEPGALLLPSYIAHCSKINIWGQFALCCSLVAGVWRYSSTFSSTHTYQGQIHMSLLFNKEICKVHRTYIYHCCAGWPALQQSRRTLLHLCQFMRRKTSELAKRPQGILEGFCITIFSFNEMLHSMQI